MDMIDCYRIYKSYLRKLFYCDTNDPGVSIFSYVHYISRIHTCLLLKIYYM